MDNEKGISSYRKLASTVISCWAKMISRLNNFSESRWILFSLTMGIFLSDDRACTFTWHPWSMSLTVHPARSASTFLLQLLCQHWLSHLLCILLRKTRSTHCLDRYRMACSQTILGQVQLPHHLASAVFSKVSVELGTFPDVFLLPLVDIKEVTEGHHPALVSSITVSHSLCSFHF